MNDLETQGAAIVAWSINPSTGVVAYSGDLFVQALSF